MPGITASIAKQWGWHAGQEIPFGERLAVPHVAVAAFQGANDGQLVVEGNPALALVVQRGRNAEIYAGGGMGRGNLVGRIDSHAGDVEETPISPKDILATTFYLLGIDPESTFSDPTGRPLPLTGTGVLRRELLG